jgi:hypothetical protein
LARFIFIKSAGWFEVMEQVVPFWTGFDKILSDRQPDHVVVAYPPIIDAKPADMATVCKHAIIAVVSSFIGRHFSWPSFILIKSVGWFEIICKYCSCH